MKKSTHLDPRVQELLAGSDSSDDGITTSMAAVLSKPA